MDDLKKVSFCFNDKKLKEEMGQSGNRFIRFKRPDLEIRYFHKPTDADGVNRLLIKTGKFDIEVLPSKGLSIGRIFYDAKPLLWEPLLDNIPHPKALDLNGDLVFKGEVIRGFRFIEHLVGGVMMFGISNWGMPYTDPVSGKLVPLHGEVSNIPVEDVLVNEVPEGIEVKGEFQVRDGCGDKSPPWYNRGKVLYTVRKNLKINVKKSRIIINDTIINRRKEKMKPDWGYTIKFHAEEGARYLVPSMSVENRFEGPVPEDHEIWVLNENRSVRDERGIIHKGLKVTENLINGHKEVETLVRYKSGNGIKAVLPESPYFLSWFSSGGSGNTDFQTPQSEGGYFLKVFQKNWDGLGPEFGSSALDHDDNIDMKVGVSELNPEEKIDISFYFEPVSIAEAGDIEQKITNFNNYRTSLRKTT